MRGFGRQGCHRQSSDRGQIERAVSTQAPVGAILLVQFRTASAASAVAPRAELWVGGASPLYGVEHTRVQPRQHAGAYVKKGAM
jgi:hypothetical protein